ncbi:MAG: hypothetical protein QOJ39_452 [Candidatus Eremiobacteraeota bacterium]|nr:hypothetical protein [Candidatus Eremiobacteraeota bacterium]
MNRDPKIRALVIRGYTKLAYILVGLVLLALPIILRPGLEGVRITQALCGVIGVGLAVWTGLKGEWTRTFSLTVLFFSLATLALAYVVTDQSAVGQVLKQVLIVSIVAAILIALPRIPMYKRKPPG